MIERRGSELTLTLNRPLRHNAYNREIRDELCEALTFIAVDDTVRTVHLRGLGPSFCSGGDLAEFGSTRDVSTAHRIRRERSAALLLDRVRDRVVVHVHGATIGAGIELAAFAGRVIAAPETWFRLPEIGMGLVPGAGGTVSVTRRIGPWRTLYLALTGDRLSADRARAWGLVDDVDA